MTTIPITPASTTPMLPRLRGRLVSHSGASSPFFYGFDPNEAQGWVPSRVKGGAVHFINTKPKRRRSIPIPPEREARILQHFKAHGLFTNCRNAFDEAVDKAGLRPPAGQKAHVLRHTFASHFMANGGSILSLQKILGHSSLSMTMRYAHLAPGHMQDVLSFGSSRDFRHFRER